MLTGCQGANPCGDVTACDDNNECTTDTCSNGVDTNGAAVAACTNTPVACSNGVCNPTDGECVECLTAADCDDDNFCNGAETCSSNGCVDGTSPCAAGETCNEASDTCDECATDADCDAGEVCSNGTCVVEAECTTDADCEVNEVCSNGTCVPDVTPCTDDTDCDAGEVCDNGECVVDTSGICVTDADCDAGEVCSNGSCVPATPEECTSNGDCDNGVFCDGTETCVANVCSNGTNPCTEDQTCDEANDNCELSPQSPVINAPTNGVASAQVGQNSTITGITVSDADNNTLTVEVASSDGFVSFGTIAAGVSATDQNNQTVAANTLRTSITLSGTITALNSTLATFRYTTDRVAGNPGTDVVTITAEDLDGNTDSESLQVGVGTAFNFTAADDNFAGTSFGDLFLATNPAWVGGGDVVNGGAGSDTVEVQAATGNFPNGPTAAFAITNTENVLFSSTAGNITADLTKVTPVSTVTWQPSNGAHTLDVNNAADGTVVEANSLNGFSGSNVTLGVINSTFGTQSLTLRVRGNGTTAFNNAGVIAQQAGSNVEVLNIVSESSAGATVTNTLSGTHTFAAGTVNVSGTQALNLGTWNGGTSTTINATGFAAVLTVTNSVASGTVQGGTAADVISGGAGAQALAGGDGADTLNGGAGVDQLTGGAGVDTHVLANSQAGAEADIVTDFTTGASGDQFDVDISALETAGAPGVNANATDFVVLNTATSTADTDAITIQELSATAAAAANANVFVLIGGTFANVAAVQTALEAGGTRAITGLAAGVAQWDTFLVVYSDGTNAFLAVAIQDTETTDDGDFEANDLTVVNIARINGVTSITAGGFNAANFDFIP
jgi:hypothetical protein